MPTQEAAEIARRKAIATNERYWNNARLARQLAVLVMVDLVVVGALIGWLIGVLVGATWLLIALGALTAAGVGAWVLARRTAWLIAACAKAVSAPVAVATSKAAASERHGELTNTLAHLCLTVGVAEPAVVVLDHPSVNLAAVGLDRYDWTLLVTRGLLENDALADPAVMEGPLAAVVTQVADGSAARTTAALTTAMLLSVGTCAVAAGERKRLWRTLARPLTWPVRPLLTRGIAHVDDTSTDEAAVGLTRYPPGLIAAYEAASSADAPAADKRASAASGPSAALWLIGNAAGGRVSLADRVAVLRLY